MDCIEFEFNAGPIGVGGVGGSGTRLIADLLSNMNVFMGDCVFETLDNCIWPPFRRLLREANATDEASRREIIFASIQRFEREMHRDFEIHAKNHHNWFWKVPTTCYWLSYLAEFFPKMKYIHVIRHGLDMAFTNNVRQFRIWARRFGLEANPSAPHEQVLEYWTKANEFAVEQASRLLGERFMLLRFEDVCFEPKHAIQQMADFVGTPESQLDMRRLISLIQIPSSIGRYRQHNCRSLFGNEIIDRVQRFGYSVEA